MGASRFSFGVYGKSQWFRVLGWLLGFRNLGWCFRFSRSKLAFRLQGMSIGVQSFVSVSPVGHPGSGFGGFSLGYIQALKIFLLGFVRVAVHHTKALRG